MKSSKPILLLIVLFAVAYISVIYLVKAFSAQNMGAPLLTTQAPATYQNPFDVAPAYQNPFDVPQQLSSNSSYRNPFFEEYVSGKVRL